jgi:sulfite reductase (NADPH) hemoprotein beta-component
MPEILTANRLYDGDVVYRTALGEWVADVDAAELIDDAAQLAVAEAAAQADVKASRVLDVVTIPVEVTDGRIVPKRLRERIRAFGPTLKSDHRPGAV